MDFGAGNAMLIIFALIILFYAKKKVLPNSSQKVSINEDIMRLNILIDRYNSMMQLFLSESGQQKEKARKFFDMESLKDILVSENSFYTSQYKLVSLLEELKQTISIENRTNTVNKLNYAEDILENMQSDADLISEKDIRDLRYHNESSSNACGTYPSSS